MIFLSSSITFITAPPRQSAKDHSHCSKQQCYYIAAGTVYLGVCQSIKYLYPDSCPSSTNSNCHCNQNRRNFDHNHCRYHYQHKYGKGSVDQRNIHPQKLSSIYPCCFQYWIGYRFVVREATERHMLTYQRHEIDLELYIEVAGRLQLELSLRWLDLQKFAYC